MAEATLASRESYSNTFMMCVDLDSESERSWTVEMKLTQRGRQACGIDGLIGRKKEIDLSKG